MLLLLVVLLHSIHFVHCGTSTRFADLSEMLKFSAEERNGFIDGNPLIYPKCRDALSNAHDTSVFGDAHWFWSQESLTAASRGLAFGRVTKGTGIADKSVVYLHIEKSASSSVSSMLQTDFDGFELFLLKSGDALNPQCAFTFVREPIHRFVSAYYTANKLLFGALLYKGKQPSLKIRNVFKFWRKRAAQRFAQFVVDLDHFGWELVGEQPLDHVSSQTGILSVARVPLQCVAKVEAMATHWAAVASLCLNQSATRGRLQRRMPLYGARDSMEDAYRVQLGFEGWQSGDVLPAYRTLAECYALYAMLADYFKQDFVCFGYKQNWTALRRFVQTKDPNWDQKIVPLSYFNVALYPN